MRRGRRSAETCEPPAGGECDFTDPDSGLALFGNRRKRHRDLAGHAFLQQKLGGLDQRFGVEAHAHHAVQNRIGKRYEAGGVGEILHVGGLIASSALAMN